MPPAKLDRNWNKVHTCLGKYLWKHSTFLSTVTFLKVTQILKLRDSKIRIIQFGKLVRSRNFKQFSKSFYFSTIGNTSLFWLEGFMDLLRCTSGSRGPLVKSRGIASSSFLYCNKESHLCFFFPLSYKTEFPKVCSLIFCQKSWLFLIMVPF